MHDGIKDAEERRGEIQRGEGMRGLRTDRDGLYSDLPSPHGGVQSLNQQGQGICGLRGR